MNVQFQFILQLVRSPASSVLHYDVEGKRLKKFSPDFAEPIFSPFFQGQRILRSDS